jgi:hypothetical protein
MKVLITPHPSYIHGHIEKTLAFLGVPLPAPNPNGTVEVELSPLQLDAFRLKGSAHQIEIIPDAPGPTGLPEGTMLVHIPPTVEEVIAVLKAVPQELEESYSEQIDAAMQFGRHEDENQEHAETE